MSSSRPYNYDIETVMNLTSSRFRGQHSDTSKIDIGLRKVEAPEMTEIVVEEEEEEGNDFTSIDKHLGFPVQHEHWQTGPEELHRLKKEVVRYAKRQTLWTKCSIDYPLYSCSYSMTLYQ